MFYGSVSGFRLYHASRGNDVTSYTDAAVEIELLKASEWIDGRFRARFPGDKEGFREQLREWPRLSAYDINNDLIPAGTIPLEVQNATYEVALKSFQTPGILNKDYTPSAYSQVSITGALHVQYLQSRSIADVQTQFAIVGQVLAPVLTGGGGANSGLSGEAIR